MGSLSDWVGSHVGSRRWRRRYVPIAERNAHFRGIGAADNSFPENLAEPFEHSQVGRTPTLASAYETLAGPVGAMVKSLLAMTGSRYHSLAKRFEEIDRGNSQEILKARPIEFGPLIMWPSFGKPLHPDEVGPNAARLSQLYGAPGVRVPPFFVVSVYGYRSFIEASGLHDLMNDRIWNADFSSADAIEVFAHEVREAVLASEMPPLLAEALLEAHAALTAQHPSPREVAVRSSAVVEDSKSSFAGQFESVLNVERGGLIAAYKQVIASKYRLAAVQCGLARDCLNQDEAMPVLVMAMVQPLASGVAYSRHPDGPTSDVVTAGGGLAQPIVEGRINLDRFTIVDGSPPTVIEAVRGDSLVAVQCEARRGLVEEAAGEGWALPPEQAVEVAQLAWSLERHFGAPQDVELALDEARTLFVLQSRPLARATAGLAGSTLEIPGYPLLMVPWQRASAGVARGTVVHWGDFRRGAVPPPSTVPVVPTTSPTLSGVIAHVAAVVAVAGSLTGLMATIAREFGVPCLVGVSEAFTQLPEGAEVTVDASSGRVYQGRVRELEEGAVRPGSHRRVRDPFEESFRRLLDRVARLTLTEGSSPDFRPEARQTLHDVARFVRQQAMAEMFAVEGLNGHKRGQRRRLPCVPPMRARLEGMGDPRLSWAGQVGFDLKGFMSVAVRSVADDQRFSEPSFALCVRDYLHFTPRLAYHFATVDSVCGKLVHENYAWLVFQGGAAVADRREWRARFLAKALHHYGLNLSHVGDRGDSILAKRPAALLEEAVVTLGRLMVAARHLDMMMGSQATADSFTRAFLSGDYGLEMMRRRPG